MTVTVTVTVMVLVFEDIGSGDTVSLNNDCNLRRLLRLTSNMVTWIDLCLNGVGRVDRVILDYVHFQKETLSVRSLKPSPLTRRSTCL